MKKNVIVAVIVSLFLCLAIPALATTPATVPVPGMVTMVDLGSHKCIPCKMMAPILTKLSKEYEEKAAIIFIDVWEEKDQGGKFGVRAIPTQVFFDRKGNEVYRHQGFMAEDAIVAQLSKMGVTPATKE